MKVLIDTYKNSGALHHAYLLEGERGTVRERLLSFIEKDLKQRIQANPDFWHRQFETFSIDDARNLRDAQANKAFSDSKKIFVLETYFMTIEAQNALLKIFEEPTANTHFFIITPTREILLPTLRSRLLIVSREESDTNLADAQTFLTSSPATRLERIKDIIEEKDKMAAIALVDGLLRTVHKQQNTPPKKLEELLKVRGYLNDRSPSLKLILEHVALIV